MREAARLLRIAIQNELTDRQRACLTLYYMEGNTMQEIAERLGTTRGNVSKRIKKPWAAAPGAPLFGAGAEIFPLSRLRLEKQGALC